ncbi:MAG: hypothetical protein IJP89_00630 [Synergistaceae bacterium]|nr:hypothetical protein [Synergistaceae bacterium]
MNGAEFLIGSADMMNSSPLPVYDDRAVNFIADISSRLMNLPESRAYPDIAALGFWCRKASIERLKAGCPERAFRLGRGVCFHVAPGNIPVNFAFSYLFGVLAGCVNVVRVSGRDFPQTGIILEVIRETLKAHAEIESRSVFVRYPADNGITAEFCRHSDARMIWGGDETVAKIRALPAMPRCVDVCFSDRRSLCVMNGNAVLEADDMRLMRLAEGFYNDTYLMDQNACSSPLVVLWLDDSNVAREKFWGAVRSVAEKRYRLQAAICTEKYLHACSDAITLPVRNVLRENNVLYRLELEAIPEDIDSLRGRGGYFYELAIGSLEEMCSIITRKCQTVTYFGIKAEAVRDVVIRRRLMGVDRVVPVGRAMDINIIWDGFDIVRTLSRIITAE